MLFEAAVLHSPERFPTELLSSDVKSDTPPWSPPEKGSVAMLTASNRGGKRPRTAAGAPTCEALNAFFHSLPNPLALI